MDVTNDADLEKYFVERGCTEGCWRVFHMTGGRHKTNCALDEDRLLSRIQELEAQLAELREEVLEWFCGRAGDYIKHEHYEKLLAELESLLPDTKEEG